MKFLQVLLALSLVWCAGGATCMPRSSLQGPLPPAAFQQAPTLPEILRVVNENSQFVSRLESSSARLSAPGFPPLQARLAYERPDRFRMQASLTPLTGQDLDLGSNSERFWLWFKWSPQPGIFFVRRDQYAASAARQMLPVEPRFLVDALGLVELDPAGQHEGPFTRTSGEYEIRSREPTTAGHLVRITVVEPQYGWVLEQHLMTDRGQLLAQSRAGEHRFYPEAGVSLPHRVEIKLFSQPAPLEMRLNVSSYQLNQLSSQSEQLWQMPILEGQPPIDLAQPGPGMNAGPQPPAQTQTAASSPAVATQPHAYPYRDFRPRYRGDTFRR